jgi:hypothetical protein
MISPEQFLLLLKSLQIRENNRNMTIEWVVGGKVLAWISQEAAENEQMMREVSRVTWRRLIGLEPI